MASSSEGSEGGVGTCEQMEASGMNPGVIPSPADREPRPDINILNDYVMEHLLSFLPMADLKTCRLVNRSWNRVSHRVILKKDHLIKFPEDRNEEGPRQENCGIDDIPELIGLIQTSAKFPWTKFKVDGSIVKTEEHRSQMSNLFRVIIPFVTDIRITDLSTNFLPKNAEYSNLRKLELRFSTEGFVHSKTSRKSALELVERAPKLQDILLFEAQNTFNFMDLLETSNWANITRLGLMWWIEDKHLVRLSEMGLQLKYLNLVFAAKNVSSGSLRAVLQSQSNYLEEFQLTCAGLFHPELECPRMNKLKVLNVNSPELFGNVSYKNQLPVLRKLKFSVMLATWLDSFFNEHVEPVETVKELDFGTWQVDPSLILQAARQFPNLRKIQLKVSRKIVNCLGLAMPQLEEIEFVRDHDPLEVHSLDGILTGFSCEEVEELNELPNDQLDMLERQREPLPFLKNLKKLCLGSQPLYDFGCRFALLKMEQLQVLELDGNYCEISDEVMEKMRKKFVVRMKNW